MKRIKVINEPSELVPVLRCVDTDLKRELATIDGFDIASQNTFLRLLLSMLPWILIFVVMCRVMKVFQIKAHWNHGKRREKFPSMLSLLSCCPAVARYQWTQKRYEVLL